MAEMKDPSLREFHFTSQDFQRVCKLIYDHAGISLSASKQELVYSRLSRRLRATGIKTFTEYLKLLEQNDVAEWEAFANSLTTNLTSFFREHHHFPLLAEQLKKIGSSHPIVIWCSASSTGEEPYSIAMTAVDAFNSFTPPVKIIATDLDTNVLDTARRGVYAMERVEKMSDAQIKRFFFKGTGAQEGFVKVRPELQNMITFRKLNLLDATWPIRDRVDVIFCRNVMIYFDKETQLAILKKMAPIMRPDGLLYAGHSENFYQAEAYFRLRGKTVYELSPQLKAAQADKS
ncbi:MAG TPA: chemotaxis protein CheR [Gallionella sp.]|nr:CheR family methyltransferase [Gallionella sp.]OGS68723.1 MAG: chemotaxis protein CheR [Gallionellales bacterium GWA2_54_124]OGT19615.1 MAG: chemotaxis protein CheR [Gallionellales bacterium RIFOXYD12_FULL_53_10]OGT35053.1 MAG: chemotaxis protein CheR [Gallionellales bacterium RIFOXYD2_FULL_52_7]HCI53351.1 chemotaxis protein CheR [Gallionella sp.]